MPVITSSNNTHLPKNIFISLSDKATQVLKIPRNGNRVRPKSLIPLSSIGSSSCFIQDLSKISSICSPYLPKVNSAESR
ncbi:hypothetical protein FOXYSP1_03455 [Fusarium oxysporum f. sp. phaseoli]